MGSFESVVDAYDAARPGYPDGVFDALGPLDGLRVLDVGAGTGIATRAIVERGADVVAVDRGPVVLGRAVERTPGLAATVADGGALPVRDETVDLICFAQSWHWMDESTRVAEMHRVVAPGGRWAAWWSHARADDQAWFGAYFSVIERWCPGSHRGQRDTDWGATVAVSGRFDVAERVSIPWVRHIMVDDWMIDQASHSYVIGLPEPRRTELLLELRRILDEQFPDGAMSVRYETWLWIATRI